MASTPTSTPPPRPRATRRDGQQTRAAILAAANDLFAERGFERTTVRAIATRAGCNAALISRYFGSKEQLFALAAQPGPAGANLVDDLASLPPQQWAAALILRQLNLAATTDRAELVDKLHMLLRSTDTPQGAQLFTDLLTDRYLGDLSALMSGPDATLRAQLIFAQLLGVALLRNVIGLRGLRQASPKALVRHLGPALDSVLFGAGPARP